MNLILIIVILLHYLDVMMLEPEGKVFLSDIVNVLAPTSLVITKPAGQVGIKLMSKLYKGILRIFQNLLKDINYFAISTYFA